jgi:serine/threonine protein kinase
VCVRYQVVVLIIQYLVDFEIGSPLGSGTTGTIYLARSRDNPQLVVAIKVVQKIALEARGMRQIEREVSSLLLVRGHANIITLFDCFQDANRIYIITEYAPYGDLYKSITTEGFVESKAAKVLLSDACDNATE